MKCRNPYVKGKAAYPCGHCEPCRYNKRRIWTHRIMLERCLHSDSAFVTLTYAEEHLPVGGSLVPADLRNFLKRLRKAISPLRLRFFAVGEYGDASWRPHYHLALFGYPACRFGVSKYSKSQSRCCASCDLVSEVWGLGHVYLGDLSGKSAGYIAGYCVKKLTDPRDERLDGRHPEFMRSSRRPGLGADALWEVGSQLMRYDLDTRMEDVPGELRVGKKLLPLGRFLRGRLRELVGKSKNAPQATLDAIYAEVSALYEGSRVAPTSEARELAFKNALIDAGSAAVSRMEKRRRIYDNGRKWL